MVQRYNVSYSYLDIIRAVTRMSDGERIIAALGTLFRAKHVFLVHSARFALDILLRAHGRLGEVIMPGYTDLVVADSIVAAGDVPVFADVGERSVNMTAETVDRSITERTIAVLITHQFGLPCEVHQLLSVCRDHHLLAIEDVAASPVATVNGTAVGSFGDASILSFHMSKVVPAGMGGALLTNNDDLASAVRRILHQHPGPVYGNSWAGFCRALAWKLATNETAYPAVRFARALLEGEAIPQRLSPGTFLAPVQRCQCARYTAALFQLQFERFDEIAERRRQLGRIYERELACVQTIGLPQIPDGVLPVWTQYPIFVRDKQDCYRSLLKRSIDVSWTFRYSVADTYNAGNCPNSTLAAASVIGLPTYPGLSDATAHMVCAAVRDYALEPASCANGVIA
jgi:dTDP-4-amino-4,6-dideoxygalactose transaminase